MTGVLSALRIDGLAWPWWLLALPLPWLVHRFLPAMRTSSAALTVPFGRRLDAIASAGGSARGRGIGVLAWLAWALLCLAAARPQQWGDLVQPPASARELMLAVDLSGSMGEDDMSLGGQQVDRLTAARAVLADFLDRRAGDRVGLLVFGDRAYAVTPLTNDLDSVRQQLDDSVVGLAGQATAIGDAIGLAVKRLKSEPASQRVLILLTDGVSNAGMLDPLKAAQLAHDEGVRIHTIGFGGEGQAMSLFGIPMRMPGGDDTDMATLQRIAQLTGGKAFRARDTDELAGIYAEIDRLEPVRHPGQRVRPRIERYPWPLAASLVLGLLAFAWPRGLRP